MHRDERLLAERERGHLARQIVDNAYFKEVYEKLRDQAHQQFAESDLMDDDARRNARIKLHGLESFVNVITRDVKTGEAAAKQIEANEAKEERRPDQRRA